VHTLYHILKYININIIRENEEKREEREIKRENWKREKRK